MVRKCTADDLNQMIELAYKKNNEPTHYSAFCYKSHEQIEKDFHEGLNSKNNVYVGYFENDILKGMLCCFIDEEKNNADCCGPFVNGDFSKISKEMLDYMKSLVTPSMNYKFFFGKSNIECASFMELINAENQGNEFQLILKRKNYKKAASSIQVNLLPTEYTNEFIKLHDSIFPGIYVSGKDIIKSRGFGREIYCVIENSKLIGYSVLQTYDDPKKATAEVISVHENYRHKGYGRALLNKILEVALSNNSTETIHLIVDKVNKNAFDLYYSMGFELLVENCCYIAK